MAVDFIKGKSFLLSRCGYYYSMLFGIDIYTIQSTWFSLFKRHSTLNLLIHRIVTKLKNENQRNFFLLKIDWIKSCLICWSFSLIYDYILVSVEKFLSQKISQPKEKKTVNSAIFEVFHLKCFHLSFAVSTQLFVIFRKLQPLKKLFKGFAILWMNRRTLYLTCAF